MLKVDLHCDVELLVFRSEFLLHIFTCLILLEAITELKRRLASRQKDHRENYAYPCTSIRYE